MSRFEFGGHGSPTPDIIIPDPHVSDHLPTQVLELKKDFVKADWVDLGYTNYEVWCVGAAGGLGGGIYDDSGVHWAIKFYSQTAPAAVWNEHLAGLAYWDTQIGKNFYTTYYTTIFSLNRLPMPHGYLSAATPETGYTGGYAYAVTHYQSEEYYNPSHLMPVYEYTSEFVTQQPYAFPGAGGGGGLHVVSGLLEDLPDVCAVVTGLSGADGTVGHIHNSGLWTPPIPEPPSWSVRYDFAPHTYGQPTKGGDGGASSFGGTICQASGGKGGNPATKWISGGLYIDGAGGQGGVGGRIIPGGGALGGDAPTLEHPTSLPNDGRDGTWDGVIGQGGGGGRGNTSVPDDGYSGHQLAV